MHELGLAVELLALVDEASQGAAVRRVIVEVGQLAAVLPDALRMAFEVARESTTAAEAQLEIVAVEGRALCRACRRELALPEPLGACSCGSVDLEWTSGHDLRLRALELA